MIGGARRRAWLEQQVIPAEAVQDLEEAAAPAQPPGTDDMWAPVRARAERAAAGHPGQAGTRSVPRAAAPGNRPADLPPGPPGFHRRQHMLRMPHAGGLARHRRHLPPEKRRCPLLALPVLARAERQDHGRARRFAEAMRPHQTTSPQPVPQPLAVIAAGSAVEDLIARLAQIQVVHLGAQVRPGRKGSGKSGPPHPARQPANARQDPGIWPAGRPRSGGG